MLSTGKFQDRLKFSEIKPAYKKIYKTLATNYAPISLRPVFSKILRRLYIKNCIAI
jgi:hypothetical protein